MAFSKKRIVSGSTTVGFVQFLPDTYDSAKKYPLIIFLHGIGERGDGSDTGLDYLLTNMPANLKSALLNVHGTREFILLAPQLPKSQGIWRNLEVDAMFEAAKALSVDPDFVYLSGLSLGGGGVWNYVMSSFTNAIKFAAILPICPVNATGTICNVTAAKLGVWNFHAKDDSVVGVGNSQGFEYNITRCTPISVVPTFTYFDNGGHNIWERVYDMNSKEFTPNVYTWLLANKKGQNVAPPPPTTVDPIQVKAGPDIVTNQSTYKLTQASVSGPAKGFWWEMVDGSNGPGQTNAWFENNPYDNLQIIIGNMKIGRTYTLRLIAQDSLGKKYSDEVKVTFSETVPPPTEGFEVKVKILFEDVEGFIKVDKEAVAIYVDATLENLKSIKKSTGETIDTTETWYMIV